MAIRTNPQRLTQRLRSEAGVSLIHIAIASFVIMGFSAFVLDHGVLMLARAQAQNVADMAALAGVTTRAMDEPGDAAPPANSLTEQAINRVVDSHVIFGDTPANTGRLWYLSPATTCPTGITGWCVKVEVFRDGLTAGSTTLPTYFGPLFGLNTQKVRATATAVATSANGTRCLKPFLIPDKWDEITPPAGVFNQPMDDYRPYVDANNIGSGYSLADIGTTVLLKPGNPHGAISPSDYYLIGDANILEESIAGCRITANIGDIVEAKPGGTVGPVNHGIDTLTANGPASVVIGMFDVEAFLAQDRTSGTFSLRIVNMIGMTINGRTGNEVTGVISGGVGENIGTAPAPAGGAGMIKQIQLVR